MGEYRATQDAETAHPVSYRGQDNLPAIRLPSPTIKAPERRLTSGNGEGRCIFCKWGERQRQRKVERNREGEGEVGEGRERGEGGGQGDREFS